MTKYLRDRVTGDLYGWNFEMAKLPNMREVDSDDDDFTADSTGPDPEYVKPPEGFPVSKTPVFDQERQEAEAAALAKAAAEGEVALDEPVDDTGLPPPEWDEDGHKLLGYDADDNPVYETDEERDERVEAEVSSAVPVEEEPTSKKKRGK